MRQWGNEAMRQWRNTNTCLRLPSHSRGQWDKRWHCLIAPLPIYLINRHP